MLRIITCSADQKDIHRPAARKLCRPAGQRTLTEQPRCTCSNNKWSKNFDERSHRRGRSLHGGQRNVTPTSLEHCSRLSPLLIFLLRKLPQHRFTMFFSGPDNPQNCPFSWGNIDLRLTHDSLGPPESILQSASQSVRPFLQGSWTWTNRQTHTDRQTTLLATNRVYALSPCDAA